MYLCLFCTSFLTAFAGAPDRDAWEATLDRAVPAVVSLRVTGTRDFDTESAGTSQGTGFIVDGERGLLLTNRHMVHAGPVIAEAVLLNNEEIPLQAIYRDPVHDFGFYRFNPEDVRHMDVVQLTLAPESARVGTEIRVIGNDAGEKISILDGTLARLDRNAPSYGSNDYNDFNTFYVQAASNTSGGSSGSPVVDVTGSVVALNAGGSNRAASSFYLPLDRVVRAMALIENGEPVTRGTIQTVFRYTPYDELLRLGLQSDTEDEARAASSESTGMLRVVEVVPGGPASGQLRPGDILTRVNGELVTRFVPLEAIIDEAVGEKVAFEVERGGRSIEVELTIGDLHAVTPAEYLEVGRGILHELSYQQARNNNRPTAGVYVAVPGYMLSTAEVPPGAIITHIDGEPVADLDAAQRVLEARGQGDRLRIRFNPVEDVRHSYETVAVMDRRWYSMRRCVRSDADGSWPCTDSPPPPASKAPEPASAILAVSGEKLAGKLAPSLVVVDFDIPHPTAGVKDFNYVGVGTVVDAEQGLILVDRDTVPVALGDMMLTFAGSVKVPGKLRYLHPAHNLAVVQYDPASLGDTPVEAIEWASRRPEKGDHIWQIGLNRDDELVSKSTSVSAIEPLRMGFSGTPRFRDSNIEAISTADAIPSLGGVLADKKGRVYAIWASFLDQRDGERMFHGLMKEFIDPVLQPILAGEDPGYRSLGVEFMPLGLPEARDRGLSDARIRQLLHHDPDRRTVFEVVRVHGGSPASGIVRDTDLLLAIDGEPATRMRDLEALHGTDKAELTVLRDAAEHTLEVETYALDGRGVDRFVSWAGLILHKPHYEVAAQQGSDVSGVYVAWLWYGSPALRYGLRPTRRITMIDDTETPDLDTFLKAVAGKRDREPVRITMESLDGTVRVGTLKLDFEYWPTQVFSRENGEWIRSAPGVDAE